jgi:hypothetical protein
MTGAPRDPADAPADGVAGDLAAGEAAALAAFRAAAAVEPPSPFATARAARDLEEALDRQALFMARWTPGRAALGAMVAACFGAGVAVGLVGDAAAGPLAGLRAGAPSTTGSAVGGSALGASPPPPGRLPGLEAHGAPDGAGGTGGASARTEPTERAGLAEPAERAALSAAGQALAAPAHPIASRTRSWRARADELVEAGDGVGAARLLVSALARDEEAAAALALVARRFPAALDVIDDELAALRGGEAMRLRCEQRLLRARDHRAVEACRAFSQQHPQHPGARTLSYAAGRVAEDLQDLGGAEEEYSRALLLSPFAGLPATDALLARARVRAARGNTDEARADLRLYLHHEPAALHEEPVRALARRLGLPLQPVSPPRSDAKLVEEARRE